MTTDDAGPLVELLQRFARGEATLADLAGGLRQTPQIALAIPPGEAVRWLKDLDAALQAKGYGAVKTTDADPPRVQGATTDAGFVLHVFSTHGGARDHAVATGLIAGDAVLPTQGREPAACLFESLNERHAGWVIDEKTAHEVTLDRPALARLYALLTLEDFARQAALQVIASGDAPHLERLPGGVDVLGFVYDSPAGATAVLERSGPALALFSAREFAPLPLLQQLLGAGLTRLVVNRSMTTERWYERDEVARMITMLGGQPVAAVNGAAPARAADPALAQGGGDLAGDPAGPAAPNRVRRAQAPMIAPPGRPDADSERAARALALRAEAKQGPLWEYIRAFAFDLDLHVPVFSERLDGHLWPVATKDATTGAFRVRAYSRADRMREALRGVPAAEQRSAHVSGVELMRWLWASPVKIEEIQLDAFKDSQSACRMPVKWVFSPIYPHFVEMFDASAITPIGLAKLTTLPGARGLQPEVGRTLVQGWKRLIGTAARDGGPPPLVEHGGRRHLPVFTTDEQFFALGSADRSFAGRPTRADAEPPFDRWLAAVREADGVILDPAAPRPLVLDHTDLLGLDAWCRSGNPPQGVDFVAAVERRRRADVLGPRVAARIVADWPGYFVAAQEAGTGVSLLKMPKGDALAAFTRPEVAAAYIEVCRSFGWITGDWEPRPILHKWTNSVFHLARNEYADGLWIDAIPDGSAGLYLDGQMLDAAVERIGEHLTPRVPGFFEDE